MDTDCLGYLAVVVPGVLLAGVGVYVGINPPGPRHRKAMAWVLVAMGLSSSILIAVQQHRDRQSHEAEVMANNHALNNVSDKLAELQKAFDRTANAAKVPTRGRTPEEIANGIAAVINGADKVNGRGGTAEIKRLPPSI